MKLETGPAVRVITAMGTHRQHAFAVLALGVGSQLSQVVLVRELLLVFHGNELSIGIALASWLFWVGIGGLACARVLRHAEMPLTPASIMAAALLAVLPMTLAVVRGVRGFFSVVPGESLSFGDILMTAVPLLAPAGILWGAQFVCQARLWRHDAAAGMNGAVPAYAGEATGNMIGGLAFSLALVHVLEPMATMALAGLLMTGALIGLSPRRTPQRWNLVVCIAATIAAFPLLGRLDSWSHARFWHLLVPDQPLIETRASRYGRIAVVRRGDQYAFYQSGHLAFSAGAADAGAHAFEEQDAALLAYLALAQHPAPRHVLLIGGGLRGVLRELCAYRLERIEYAELDPVLIETAWPRVPEETREALRDPRVRVSTVDGRLLVKTTDSRYDLIVVDVPDPVTAVLNRFYTQEFFHEAKRLLRPGGVLSVGVTSTAGLRDVAAANRNATVYHTLKRAFPHVLAIGDRFLVFFAGDTPGQLSGDPRVLLERHRTGPTSRPRLSDAHLLTVLHEATLRRTNWILRHHGRGPKAAFEAPAPGPLFPPSLQDQESEEASLPPVDERFFINSDFRPIAYAYSLMFWDRHARGGGSAVLSGILRVRAWWATPLLFGVLLASIGIRLVAGGPTVGNARLALWFAVCATGFSTMSAQVALLFAFQSQYGFVYEMIGAIVAAFMGGLALGALGSRPSRSWGRLARIQLIIGLWGCVMAIGMPASARLASPGVVLAVFFGMTTVAGIWNGAHFPTALACAESMCRRGARGQSRVGAVYGIELLGACLGALLAGVVIIPVLGIPACCLLAAALNIAAFLVILTAK